MHIDDTNVTRWRLPNLGKYQGSLSEVEKLCKNVHKSMEETSFLGRIASSHVEGMARLFV